ncbi:MAG: neutral/alkaline non-lysosomal ceramidase N-terminal domain-containing protein [Bacteriovoracaceae bacterium]|nr:neutral/alkaline non-lysosomal ceramidase N-terminal domain-containing protein [Bacteriovoracaceae bacterium]
MKTVFFFIFLLSSFLSFAQESFVNVGISMHDLKPEIGIPLAGYGSDDRRIKGFADWTNKYPHSFFFKPSEGVRDPIQSKVMVIEKDGRYLVFVSLDMIGVTRNFVTALAYKVKHLGIKFDDLIVTGTHTHSGPGTLSKNLALNLIAVDLFKQENFDDIVEKTYASILEAYHSIEPADLYSTEFLAQGIQQNKFRHKDQEWFDNKASFLLARSRHDGRWLGGMLNFAVHGNAMHTDDMRYSGDFPGALAKHIEQHLMGQNQTSDIVPVLFMNGAEGDVRHKGDRGEEIMEGLAADFAQQASAVLKVNKMQKQLPKFKYTQKSIYMGMPGFPLKQCAKRDGYYGNWMKVLPGKIFRIPMYGFFPMTASLTSIQIGDILMMTWPGETSTSLGWELQAMAKKEGYSKSWVLGLTNDYLAYFTNKDEFFESAYDSCSSIYNWRGGKKIIKGHKRILSKK